MKKVLSILVSVLVIIGLVGCTAAPAEPTPEADGSPTDEATMVIGLSVSTLNNPFFVTLVDGAKAKADELGVELIVVDAGDDSAKQVNDIEDLMSKNIQVLIVNPVDSSAVAPVIGDVIAKGIKTVSVDRGVEGQTVDVAIASDNVLGAELATEYLVELIGQGAKVAELTGVEGASAAIDRGKGFHNIADQKLDVVASQTANFNRAEGLSVMENILQANSDIKGVFCQNDEMALGALEAISNVGKKDQITVVGFDGTEGAISSVKDGKLDATVAQQPDKIGELGVNAAVEFFAGKTIPANISSPLKLVEKN